MIAWLTTVEPLTAYAVSVTQAEYRSSSDVFPTDQFTVSQYQHWRDSGYAFINWSKIISDATYAATYGYTATSVAYDDSGSKFVTENGDTSTVIQTGTTYTDYNTRNVETSSTQTSSRQIQLTTTESLTETAWTTSSSVSTFTTNVLSFGKLVSQNKSVPLFWFTRTETEGTRLTTSDGGSTVWVNTVSTTLPETEADPQFYATVYQAVGNEVIWAASASDFTGQMAPASLVGSSQTRMTVMPNTVTKTLDQPDYEGLTKNNCTQTEITASFRYEVPSTVASAMTVLSVEEFTRIPLQTQTVSYAKPTKTQSETTVTLVASSEFTGTEYPEGLYTVHTTIPISSFYTVVGLAYGQESYRSLSSSVGTTDVISSSPFAAIYKTDSYGDSYGLTESVTAYDAGRQGVATSMAGSCQNLVLAPYGVWGGGNVAAFYDAPFSMALGEDISVSQSRGISTLFPGTYSVLSGTVSGTLTLSGLEATYKFPTDSTTKRMALSPSGKAATVVVANQLPLRGGFLGALETKWEYTPRGVYRVYAAENNQTIYDAGGFRSFVGARDTSFLEPLSYLVASGNADAVWASPRNVTTYPAS